MAEGQLRADTALVTIQMLHPQGIGPYGRSWSCAMSPRLEMELLLSCAPGWIWPTKIPVVQIQLRVQGELENPILNKFKKFLLQLIIKIQSPRTVTLDYPVFCLECASRSWLHQILQIGYSVLSSAISMPFSLQGKVELFIYNLPDFGCLYLMNDPIYLPLGTLLCKPHGNGSVYLLCTLVWRSVRKFICASLKNFLSYD